MRGGYLSELYTRSRSSMTVRLASWAAEASLARSAGRSREAAALRRAWLRSSMAALRRLFSSQRTSGMAKKVAA